MPLSGKRSAWIRALRLDYYPATFLILFVGISVAYSRGIVHKGAILWMVLGNVLLHCACSLINEYADFVTGADLVEYPRLKWKGATGGSKVLIHEVISPNHVLYVSLFLFFVSLGIWLMLARKTGYVLVLLAVSLGITFLYSAAFSKGGFYYVREAVLSFVAVPFIVFSVVKILSGAYTVAGVVAGVYTGMHMMNYLLYHGFIDLKADLQSGKLRVTRVLGADKTLFGSEVLLVGSFVVLAVSLYCGILPGRCALPFVLVPLAVKIGYAELKRTALLETYVLVVLLFVLSVFLLSVGFWL